ncbi:NCS2 family permease [Thalassotalea agarivorans]|uniref:Putative MFS transporter, AGZA family, xanthine/uracil permease n=1 Tax=Thalassotalea agarivorans TaxID=349064 RepID=A0A1I0HEJ7_THASX|nr:NCS2 family permease [Thalassotalea agarivorans]SET81448.1 putative MFS transporter, AGZA family, xanthine/uracil permease [Thalassotalea agarivorans]
MFEKLFQLTKNNTSIKQEVIAGLTTFLTMAYIIFVNPSMLSATGMDQGAVFVATCLAAAIGCFIMGFLANYPIALAPGMGLNAFFTYTVVLTMGYTWQVALGAVFISGTIFTLLSLFKVREWIINSIPHSLRFGIAAGIGLFLAFIALKNAGIVVDNPATLVSVGNITSIEAILAAVGLFIIVGLANRGFNSAIIISILAITFIAVIIGKVDYAGIVSMPPAVAPTFAQLDIAGAFEVGMISVIFAFLFVDLFDTSGTLIAVAQKGKLLDESGKLPRLGKALLSDSTATMAGSVLGTSTTTSYVESTAGVSAGGKTGLTAVTVGILFLFALFFSPLAGMVPAYATAAPLFFVAVLMLAGLVNVKWDDLLEAVPVAVICITMPLTFSIAHGIGFGFIAYAAVRIFAGRFKEISPSVAVLALLFIVKFAFLG